MGLWRTTGLLSRSKYKSLQNGAGDELTSLRMTIKDLMRLFGNVVEDEGGRPFIMVDNPDPRGGFRADRDHEGYADEL